MVALRVAQAQTPTYTISVTPDKVLESGNAVTITVNVTVDPAPDSAPSVYLHIANETDGDGCDIIHTNQCVNPANIRGDTPLDLNDRPSSDMTINWDSKNTLGSATFNISPKQDSMIEGDEKIYLALCDVMVDDNNECAGGNVLAMASITIVGERVWADNTGNTDTTTIELKENLPIAASFTTGLDPLGYRTNNVKLQFGQEEVDDPNINDAPANLSVTLYKDVGGQPVMYIGALNGPAAPPKNTEAIYAISTGVLLDPGATYWVWVEGSGGLLRTTPVHSQTGWSIQDGVNIDTQDMVAVPVPEWMLDASRSLKMQVSGVPRGGVIIDTDADTDGAQTDLRMRENSSSTYSVRLDSPPLKDTKVEVVSTNRSIATAVHYSSDSVSTTTLTFTKGNWWMPQEVTVHGGFVNGDLATTIGHSVSGDSVRDPASLPDVRVSVEDAFTAVTLLDNIENSADRLFSHDSNTTTIAQRFTVGTDEYSLSYVQVDFASTSGGVEVRVCAEDSVATEDAGGDCLQYTGTEMPSAGLHTYHLASEKTLSARKSYYVVVCTTSGSVHLTDDTNEVHALGWSLDDKHVAGIDSAETLLKDWTKGDGVAKVKLIGYQIPTTQAPTPTPSPTPSPTPTLTPTATGSPTATVQAADATATAQAATATALAATATALADPTAQANATATAQANATATPTPVAGPGVAPSGLRVAERTRSTATLSWIPGRDATSQAILAITAGDTKFDLNLSSNARSHTFTGLEPKVYTYLVVGFDASGNYKAPSGSLYSASVTDNGPPVLDAKPKNLSVRRTGNTAILSWTPGTQADSHIVAAIIEGDSSATKVSPLLAADTDSYTFGGLKQGVYTYYVLARDRYGDYYFGSVEGSP